MDQLTIQRIAQIREQEIAAMASRNQGQLQGWSLQPSISLVIELGKMITKIARPAIHRQPAAPQVAAQNSFYASDPCAEEVS